MSLPRDQRGDRLLVVPLVAGKDFPSSSEAWESLLIPEKRRIITALIGRVVVRRGRGLDVGRADRATRRPRG